MGFIWSCILRTVNGGEEEARGLDDVEDLVAEELRVAEEGKDLPHRGGGVVDGL